MKNQLKKSLLLLSIFVVSIFVVQSQTKSTTETVKIKTSAVCGSCKTRIENDLAYAKGVRKVALDLPSKVVTVEYDPKKTDVLAIKKAVTMIGYDADELTANAKAYKKLPACCKKDAPAH